MKKIIISVLALSAFLLFIRCENRKNADEIISADIIIYGGTSTAVIAAISIDEKTAVSELSYEKIKAKLIEYGQRI